jgi:flagellar biosynthetic protein FlhB
MIAATMMMHPTDAAGVLLAISMSVVSAVLVASCVLLAVDILWSRHHWVSKLRMTHQQMKDEMKESDGDPALKAKRMALQRQRIKRMIADVPTATVIITNPTHVAVALRYDAHGAGVPQLVAKGVDEMAQRIKAVAAEAGVPMVEDVPLARALNRSVEVGQHIPREFFEVVAAIIHLITVRRPARGTVIRRTGFARP